LPRRHVERVDDALHDVERDDVADGDVTGQRQRCERERLQHRDGLRHDEQAMAVEAIDDDAGERSEEERRELAGEADDAEEERRSRQPIDQPARRGRRDPGADERNNLSAEEKLVVAIAQRAKHEGDAAGLRLGHACLILRTAKAVWLRVWPGSDWGQTGVRLGSDWGQTPGTRIASSTACTIDESFARD